MDSRPPDVAWVRMDDGYARHRKMLAAGAEGVALDVAGMGWAAEKGTDGFVPDYAVTVLYPVRNPRAVAARLEQVGRWERDNDRGGWQIHDFLDYNPSAAEVADLKAARSEAGQRGGQNSQRRQALAKASGQASASPNGTNSEAIAGASCEPPIPLKSKSTPLPPDGGAEGFDEFWDAYPRRDGKKLEKAKAVAVWKRLTKPKRAKAMAGVVHYAKACNTGLTKAKDAFRWLRDGCWVDWQEPARPSNPTNYETPTTSYDVPPTMYT